MNGLSREAYFFFSTHFLCSVWQYFSTVLLIALSLILGLKHTPELSLGLIFSKSYYALAYFLELLTFFLSVALFTAILLKRSGLSIIVFLLLYTVIEPVTRFYLPDFIAQKMPFKAIGNLIDVPNTSLMKLFGVNFRTYVDISDILLAVFYTASFIFFKLPATKKNETFNSCIRF